LVNCVYTFGTLSCTYLCVWTHSRKWVIYFSQYVEHGKAVSAMQNELNEMKAKHSRALSDSEESIKEAKVTSAIYRHRTVSESALYCTY
jgi:hypothetical protein